MLTYLDFLKTKMVIAEDSGIEIDPSEVHPILFPHQRDAVLWAVRGGRRALFESFGLGKTLQSLEYCRLILKHKGGRALIVMPLGVRQEFRQDASKLDIPVPEYVRTMAEARNAKTEIVLTNYERVRDGDIDPKYFTVVVLDEASVLRSYGSDTYQTFLPLFKDVPYKLVCTATPSPNRYKEIIHYAGFLEIMDTGQALTRFFQRDSQKANNLTLYPHKEDEFWLWVSSWALFITKPSDLGYSDVGYDLPPLDIRCHKLSLKQPVLEQEKSGQIKLMRDAAAGLKDAAREKRESIEDRVAEAKKIIDSSPDEHFIIWHDLEDERRLIKKLLPECKEIYGTQDYDLREQTVVDFSEGKFRLLATKKKLSGQGCNFQKYCHRSIFIGIDYKFNDFIQAIHRTYRFLQKEQVVIDIIYTENEQQILFELMEKWRRHDYMAEKMREIVKKYGLGKKEKIASSMARSIGVEKVRIIGQNYIAVNNDCVEETKTIKDNSLGMILTSIPFSNHYEYTPSYNDFGHNKDTEDFFRQMDFLSPELLRALQPGRVFCCHVKDRVLFGNATGTGMPTIEPFHALCISHYMKHGFQYFGMITILTDVVRENNQTYRLGYSEMCKDASKMGRGCPEYILLFRKLPTDTSTAYADNPVSKSKADYSLTRWQIDADGFYRSSGDRCLTLEEITQLEHGVISSAYRKYSKANIYNFKEHCSFADKLDELGKMSKTYSVVQAGSWSPDVWDDINRMNTLNADQYKKRKQYHVCPLQLDIIERCIEFYSNEGDLVYDPFGGLFSVGKVAVEKGRKAYMCELNLDYFKDGCGYLDAAEQKMLRPTLFDFIA